MVADFLAYLDSIKARDPAPRSRWEVLTYPGLLAVALHRVAHWLFGAGLFFLARFVNHAARWLTGIDIHPGARIGRRLFIDHGMGVVIGETADIGDDVTIYQGVTLGGTDPANGIGGKRHPTIAPGAILGAGAQVLGPIQVGENARVGANAVVTREVEPGAVMVGIPARRIDVNDPEPARDFVPYGTSCREMFDPDTQQIELLQCQLAELQTRVAKLSAEVAAARSSASA